MGTMGRGLALVALLAGPAAAEQFELELGVRVEGLAFDEGIEFRCTCDPEEDPGCDTDPGFCQDARLEQPMEGYMIGALAGGQMRSRWLGGGLRVVASAGSFSPQDPDPGVKDEGVLLTQIVAELRVEAHAALGPAEIFVQASPRFGGLFYLAEEGDSPSSFVAGVLLTAGLRFGGDERRVGAEAGAVVHSSFGGWLAQGTYNLGMDPPHDEQPPVPIDDIPVPGEAPVEEGEAPPG